MTIEQDDSILQGMFLSYFIELTTIATRTGIKKAEKCQWCKRIEQR